MKEKQARFHLYRYQLLPINRFFQADMYGALTVDELIARKNEYFQEALKWDGTFKTSRTATKAKALFERENFSLYRIAANRALNHETQDFQTEVIENWPKILVAIWNEPDKQLIAVQHRSAAFQNTGAVMKLIFDSLEPVLSKKQLTAIWEPLIERNVFWDLVRNNQGKIQEVEFEIITPNMVNISGSLPEDLKNFARQTNSVRNKISISAEKTSALQIEENNETIAGLVDYSNEGGGDISIKINGYTKKVHTSKTVREISIDEVSLIGEPDDVAKILKHLLS